MGLNIDSVENQGRMVIDSAFVQFIYSRKRPLVEQTGTDDEHCKVGILRNDGRVSYNVHRRAVHEDVIVPCGKVFHHLREPV